nr:hypothetical protein [Tanacetum cinerariifolium]
MYQEMMRDTIAQTRVESSGDEDSLGEDASKQGRRINVIDADKDITLVNDVDNEMFDVDTLVGDEVFVARQNKNVIKEVVDAAQKKLQQLEQVANLSTYPLKHFNSFCYDDDDDDEYTVVITPDFLITDSLIMENEHLDTILKTELDEFIKSSVENLVPIPSESEDFSDIESECDMPDCDDSITTKFSMISNPLFNDSTSSDDESSHEEISSGSTTTHSDSSLYDSFIFDLSISPFPPADRSDFYEFVDELTHIISPPKYDCFCFKIEPNSGDFTMNVMEDIFPTRERRVHNALPTHPTFN